MLFGPAYKGIPIATAVAVAWSELFGEAKEVAFSRKEPKTHGEASAAADDALILDACV